MRRKEVHALYIAVFFLLSQFLSVSFSFLSRQGGAWRDNLLYARSLKAVRHSCSIWGSTSPNPSEASYCYRKHTKRSWRHTPVGATAATAPVESLLTPLTFNRAEREHHFLLLPVFRIGEQGNSRRKSCGYGQSQAKRTTREQTKAMPTPQNHPSMGRSLMQCSISFMCVDRGCAMRERQHALAHVAHTITGKRSPSP